jgi:4a-hydroxytetrahydrobiopterin dehydratase
MAAILIGGSADIPGSLRVIRGDAVPVRPQRSLIMPLTDSEISSRLKTLPDWNVEAGELARTFTFKDFVASLAFVNKVGELAEKAGHHPDIDIRYNRVRLGLVTHDAGGITAKDFDLAAAANKLV